MWCPNCGDSDRMFWVNAKMPAKVTVEFSQEEPSGAITDFEDADHEKAEIAPGAMYECAECGQEFKLIDLSATAPEPEDEEDEDAEEGEEEGGF